MTELISGLSTTSIDGLIKAIRSYQDSLESKLNLLIQRLGDIGVKAAVSVVRHDTGQLAQSIEVDMTSDSSGVLVVAEGEYVAYVEFGTGIVGSMRGYPSKLPRAWDYSRPKKTALTEDPERWVYYNKRRERFETTKGQAANAFMWRAAYEMKMQVLSVAKEVFA